MFTFHNYVFENENRVIAVINQLERYDVSPLPISTYADNIRLSGLRSSHNLGTFANKKLPDVMEIHILCLVNTLYMYHFRLLSVPL